MKKKDAFKLIFKTFKSLKNKYLKLEFIQFYLTYLNIKKGYFTYLNKYNLKKIIMLCKKLKLNYLHTKYINKYLILVSKNKINKTPNYYFKLIKKQSKIKYIDPVNHKHIGISLGLPLKCTNCFDKDKCKYFHHIVIQYKINNKFVNLDTYMFWCDKIMLSHLKRMKNKIKNELKTDPFFNSIYAEILHTI